MMDPVFSSGLSLLINFDDFVINLPEQHCANAIITVQLFLFAVFIPISDCCFSST